MDYLHNYLNIIHRDIKPSNILLDDNFNIKLADFGSSSFIKNNDYIINDDKDEKLARTYIGTPYYMSPEICLNSEYSNKTDIWSLGCMLYEMIKLENPFYSKNQAQLVLKILYSDIPEINNNIFSKINIFHFKERRNKY